MSAMREAQQAWDNMLPPDTSRQEREHELACKSALARYLQTGDLPGREGASHVWGALENDDASSLILFDMLAAYRADNDAVLLALAKRVAGRVDNIVNGMITEVVWAA